MPAALLMTSLQARVRVLAEQSIDVAEMLMRLNRHTAANCPSNRFITFFIATVDPQTGALTYANAGHNPPMLMRANGSIEMLTGGGLIMGLFPKATYESYSEKLNAGDALVIFSDGVTEATNAAGEEYGEDRLAALLQRCIRCSANGIANAITKDLAEFVAGAPAADDVTVVVVRKTP
jgi:serine phosphatase RsbU (regulator of sigma subunit)